MNDIKKNKTTDITGIRRRILSYSLAAILITGLVVSLITIFSLYRAAFNRAQVSLIDTARTQARLIEAVARFDQEYSQDVTVGGAAAATIQQIKDAHSHDHGLGRTGEFTLARLDGGDIMFILDRRHGEPGDFMTVPFEGSTRAEPMRRALLGQSGTVVGEDYRGERVLAAYEPVAILDLGIVAKIDLEEIRGPFIRAGLIALGVGGLFTLLSGFLLVRVNSPMIRKIERATLEARLMQEAADIASETSSIEDALQAVVELICKKMHWPVGHVYRVSVDDDELLEPTNIWYLEQPDRMKIFLEVTAKSKFKKGHGLPGRIFESGQLEWITNIVKDPNFPRGQMAKDIGVKGGVGFPVVCDGRTAAILEFFSYEPLTIDDDMNQALVNVAEQIQRVFERIHARQALTKSESQFRYVFESMDDGYIKVDMDSRPVLANPAAVRIFGYPSEEEFLATPLTELQRYPEKHEELTQALMKEEGFKGVEVEMRRYDGEYIVVELDGRLVVENGESFVEETFRDITQRKKADEQIRVAKKAAEEANHAKSAFLANMSHELRTPMNAIIGYSEMLMEDAEDEGHDDYVDDLKKINSAGNHLLSLINDVLDLSKIEAGKMDLYLENIDLGKMLNEVGSTIQTLVKKKNNEFQIDIQPDIGEIYADLTKVRQVLFNLISNAAKFTTDGTITLRATRKAIDGEDRVWLSVKDSGIGIPADKIDSLFEEFTQADVSTTREFGGTGLGLTISLRFCRMMGGDITVESTVGDGSTFTIELPAIVAMPEKDAEKHDATAESGLTLTADQRNVVPDGAPTVLVIDDEDDARELIHRMLVKEGYNVVTASSGEEGISLARETRPMAITLDVIMPKQDGWSVLTELKADAELSSIPVIMVTMISDQSVGYSLGAADYLTKPIDRSALSRTLQKFKCANPPCAALIVDDDDLTREVIGRMMDQEGWEILEARNGREALACMEKNVPEIILLDLMMPVMDGFEFVAELRKNAAWRGIPIIVVTAKDLTDEDRTRLNGDVINILEKGAVNQDQLLSELRDQVSACNVAK